MRERENKMKRKEETTGKTKAKKKVKIGIKKNKASCCIWTGDDPISHQKPFATEEQVLLRLLSKPSAATHL